MEEKGQPKVVWCDFDSKWEKIGLDAEKIVKIIDLRMEAVQRDNRKLIKPTHSGTMGWRSGSTGRRHGRMGRRLKRK